jgi:hypothetical protein
VPTFGIFLRADAGSNSACTCATRFAGKVHRYWRLVRSVRVGRRVVQQTVAQLGELDERGRIEARRAGAPADRRLLKKRRCSTTAANN